MTRMVCISVAFTAALLVPAAGFAQVSWRGVLRGQRRIIPGGKQTRGGEGVAKHRSYRHRHDVVVAADGVIYVAQGHRPGPQ
jgi:hypothetical protein